MSHRWLLSSLKPQVPSLTPSYAYCCRNDPPALDISRLGVEGSQRNPRSYKDGKLKEQQALWRKNIKRMRFKRGSLASPWFPWISKRPQGPLPLFNSSYQALVQLIPLWSKECSLFICIILRAQSASNKLATSALFSLERKWANVMFKGIFFSCTTSTWSSSFPRSTYVCSKPIAYLLPPQAAGEIGSAF